MSLSLLLQP
jgi:hypothetical protein